MKRFLPFCLWTMAALGNGPEDALVDRLFSLMPEYTERYEVANILGGQSDKETFGEQGIRLYSLLEDRSYCMSHLPVSPLITLQMLAFPKRPAYVEALESFMAHLKRDRDALNSKERVLLRDLVNFGHAFSNLNPEHWPHLYSFLSPWVMRRMDFWPLGDFAGFMCATHVGAIRMPFDAWGPFNTQAIRFFDTYFAGQSLDFDTPDILRSFARLPKDELPVVVDLLISFYPLSINTHSAKYLVAALCQVPANLRAEIPQRIKALPSSNHAPDLAHVIQAAGRFPKNEDWQDFVAHVRPLITHIPPTVTSTSYNADFDLIDDFSQGPWETQRVLLAQYGEISQGIESVYDRHRLWKAVLKHPAPTRPLLVDRIKTLIDAHDRGTHRPRLVPLVPRYYDDLDFWNQFLTFVQRIPPSVQGDHRTCLILKLHERRDKNAFLKRMTPLLERLELRPYDDLERDLFDESISALWNDTEATRQIVQLMPPKMPTGWIETLVKARKGLTIPLKNWNAYAKTVQTLLVPAFDTLGWNMPRILTAIAQLPPHQWDIFVKTIQPWLIPVQRELAPFGGYDSLITTLAAHWSPSLSNRLTAIYQEIPPGKIRQIPWNARRDLIEAVGLFTQKHPQDTPLFQDFVQALKSPIVLYRGSFAGEEVLKIAARFTQP